MPDPRDLIEVDLVLEALARHHGYDFRGYARPSLRRRLAALTQRLGLETIAALVPLILYDQTLLPDILSELSVPVTEMFRDSAVFAGIRERLFPSLATRPEITIWQAGCASGEEVYSLAILLAEAGLLDRTRILATDFNDQALAKATEGCVSASVIDKATEAYAHAGGGGALTDHFSREGEMARISPTIRDHISFSHHNLVTDAPVGRFDLVMCRNVLIYFDRDLQDRVLGLFAASLSADGFLCLGAKENVGLATGTGRRFATLDRDLRLFRKAS